MFYFFGPITQTATEMDKATIYPKETKGGISASLGLNHLKKPGLETSVASLTKTHM